ncbi:hypothetical protein BZG00_15670 [Salinivibrio kushneri]|uniref:ATP-dependent Clp protease proteolytic subunit n=2 Tax=Pseudomonadota TaxID=1224 RepID=A0A922NYM8_9HYPH|nr:MULTISPECIES: Clp protease ClpP [Pseudomonadota]YP_008126087.1 ATP-dependent protease [Alteromonas phage vB_AmaP_AD45-P1]AGM47051.1 hypothetical protein AD45P3_00565 [Alteromonas phage vB_AmaP_AD45-P3]AGM47167.1 hypothetical protein AD45P4_00560 [Alteromonas phage vB_AmaP_AD45-P4]AGM47289.1 hypothetical protein AD45P2_00590 [Alteromonas phage vB_AmaP_AD45-P2]AGM46934.1 hypothetical protein AD45P1_00580 [Alteromonas phage vB_AmaP_AD45-P1]KEQ05593.1 hypothetical protein GV68_08675 [Pseudorhi
MNSLSPDSKEKTQKRVWEYPVPIVKGDNPEQVDAYLTGTIDEPSYYNELCHVLGTAEEGHSVTLHINTPGGIVDTALMVAEAIENSKASVTANIYGTVASAGTVIALACDDLVTSRHVSFMIHNYSGGMQGKGHEMKARQKYTDAHLSSVFNYYYGGFLTEEEMERVIEGSDIWIGAEEVAKRWQDKLKKAEGSDNG